MMKTINITEAAIVVIVVTALFTMGLEARDITLAAVSGLTGVLVGKAGGSNE